MVNIFYKYEVVDKSGNISRGFINKSSKTQAKEYLLSRGNHPLYIKKVKLIGLNKIDYSSFFKKIYDLLKVGFYFNEIFKIMSKDSENTRYGFINLEILESLQKGSSLSAAFQKLDIFPEFVINLVEIGEVSGNIEHIFYLLYEYYKEKRKIRKKIKSELFYPLLLVIMSLIMFLVLMIYIIPVFEVMFIEYNIELLWTTKILISFSKHIKKSLFISFTLIFIILMIIQYLKKKHKYFMDTIKIKIFKIYLRLEFLNFFQIFYIGINSGLELNKIFSLLKLGSSNLYFREKIELLTKNISEGHNLYISMKKLNLFPNFVLDMIKIGEITGTLDEKFNKLYDYYRICLLDYIYSIVSKISPLVIIIISIFVLWISLSLSLPILSLMESIV